MRIFGDIDNDKEVYVGRSRNKNSHEFEMASRKFTKGRKLKKITTNIERIDQFDLYRFFKKYGKIKQSQIKSDANWGCYFSEAVILYNDYVVEIHCDRTDPFDRGTWMTVHHKRMPETIKLPDIIKEWRIKNSVFRGQQFTFPDIQKPKMTKAQFVNDAEKKLIEENTLLFFRNMREIRKRNIKAKRGIILYGNPGNGKTSICRWISKSLPGVTRIWITCWDIESENVSDLFEIARNLAPSVIFMEDIDTAGISRRATGRMNPLLGRLLNEMDGLERNDGVVVIATTNNIYALDEALAKRPGRFDMKIKIGNPKPHVVKRITGHADNITLAEAFRRKEDRIYYEKILRREYMQSKKQKSPLHYIG